MTLFSSLGPVNSEPPRTRSAGRSEAPRHRRETANTGAQANGAGSAVDGTPRPARAEAIRFGVTGLEEKGCEMNSRMGKTVNVIMTGRERLGSMCCEPLI